MPEYLVTFTIESFVSAMDEDEALQKALDRRYDSGERADYDSYCVEELVKE